MTGTLLTINTGSSSLKAALYPLDSDGNPLVRALVTRIALAGSRMRIVDVGGATLLDQEGDLPDHASAVREMLAWLGGRGFDGDLRAVGHRVVHGGSRYVEPQPITAALIDAVEKMVPIDPDHLPQALDAIREAGRAYPKVPQVACFDTAFHRHMPRVAQLYALPSRLAEAGVIRYGFHGLSYEYIMQELRTIDPGAADGRVIIAHLGNGASMAAVRDGVGVDTTMGFSPIGGLMMGTRSGDLDPGVLLYLLREQGTSAAFLSDLVNQEAGLLGVSGVSADMRDLLDREAVDAAAATAVELFCYQAKKFLGALVAVLGGLDTLIFTAGIGENAASVRQRICAGLGFVGVALDPHANEANAPVISGGASHVVVRVMKTDEDLMIARHTRSLVMRGG
ncbi:MAG: acetate/propionate family kinase [Dehalococcoidia bacterium]|jgi:acetate kinase